MKRSVLLLGAFVVLSSAWGGRNLPDYHDANEVPAELEERENEEVNLSDPVDENTTPDVLEPREKEEEWRDDYEEDQFDAIGD